MDTLRIQFGIILAGCLVASTSFAGPFDLYGAGPRGSAMGAQSASSGDAWSIYYNVAGLADSTPGFSIGGFATHNNAQILLKARPGGYEIPDIEGARYGTPSGEEPNARRDTDDIAPIYALQFSGVTSLGIERLRLGFIAHLPTTELLVLKTHFADERERLSSNQLQFELIDGQSRRFAAEAGVAYRATDWLSVGVGGTFLTGANVGTDVFVRDPTDQSNTDINADVTTENRWGLLAGVQVALPLNLRLGLSYRGPVSFRIQGENEILVSGAAGTETQRIDWTPKYSPSSFNLGASWEVGAFEIAADARWIRWSEYRDTQSQRPEFSDVLSSRIGLEYDTSEESRLRLGLGWDPSPVPDQTGRTNYVDNSRFLASIGSSHDLLVAGLGLEWSWFLQFQFLMERETDKAALNAYPECAPGVSEICDEVPDTAINPQTGLAYPEAQGLQTGNPGFPGYVSGGWIGALGMEVRF